MKLIVDLEQKKCWFIQKEDMEIAYENAKCEGQIIENNMIYDMK